MASVMLSCGEASGDLYAGALVRELRALDPGLEAFGFGGPELERVGAELLGSYRGLTVTGLTEVVKQLPRTYAMYRRLVNEAARRQPDVFVAIDFPDFNLRLAAALAKLGIPVVYYVSPQLWAWRPGRLKTLKRVTRLMLVIFPFESEIYQRAGVPVRFVGHPLIDQIPASASRATVLTSVGLDPQQTTVALLPGSRPNELREILPTLVESARVLASTRPGTQFVVARAPHLDDALFAPLEAARTAGIRFAVVEQQTDAALSSADLVITASGTATVQTALHEKPMIIVYRLSPMTYRLGIRFVRVDTYGMVNLVAGKQIVPELMQDDFTVDRVVAEARRLLDDGGARLEMIEGLREVKTRLGGPGASRRAAEAVLDVARTRRAT